MIYKNNEEYKNPVLFGATGINQVSESQLEQILDPP